MRPQQPDLNSLSRWITEEIQLLSARSVHSPMILRRYSTVVDTWEPPPHKHSQDTGWIQRVGVGSPRRNKNNKQLIEATNIVEPYQKHFSPPTPVFPALRCLYRQPPSFLFWRKEGKITRGVHKMQDPRAEKKTPPYDSAMPRFRFCGALSGSGRLVFARSLLHRLNRALQGSCLSFLWEYFSN